MQAFSKAEFTD